MIALGQLGHSLATRTRSQEKLCGWEFPRWVCEWCGPQAFLFWRSYLVWLFKVYWMILSDRKTSPLSTWNREPVLLQAHQFSKIDSDSNLKNYVQLFSVNQSWHLIVPRASAARVYLQGWSLEVQVLHINIMITITVRTSCRILISYS